MATQFFYGAYGHGINEVALTTDINTALDAAKLAYARVARWTITGVMIGNGFADLAPRQAIMEAAYALNYQDARLVDADSGQPLMTLSDGASYTGVRVIKPPSFPKGDGAEYATERTYQIVLEAEYQLPVTPNIVSFAESVKLYGGGPLIVWQQGITGPPRRQILCEQTTYKAEQTGTAVYRGVNAGVMPPLFPGFETRQPEITEDSFQREGKALLNKRVTWSYAFESAAPLLASPHEWPAI